MIAKRAEIAGQIEAGLVCFAAVVVRHARQPLSRRRSSEVGRLHIKEKGVAPGSVTRRAHPTEERVRVLQ